MQCATVVLLSYCRICTGLYFVTYRSNQAFRYEKGTAPYKADWLTRIERLWFNLLCQRRVHVALEISGFGNAELHLRRSQGARENFALITQINTVEGGYPDRPF